MEESPERQTTEIILESIADGVFTVDADWRITSFNRAAEGITGVRRDEAIGQRCCDVFRASICESACVLKETPDTGRPAVNKAIYVLSAEGERVPISISAAVLRDADGNALFPETFGGGLGTERCLFALCLGDKNRQVDQVTLFGKNPDSYPLYLF